MAGHGSSGRIDVVRKGALIVVLVAAMLGMHQFAIPPEEFEARGLLALGFVILASYTIGELAEVVKLPHITGYLLAGLALGPSVAHIIAGQISALPPPLDEGILNQDVIDQLVLLDSLALALIALTAGGELQLKELRSGIVQITGVLAGQAATVTLGTTGFLVGSMALMPSLLPALGEVSPVAVAALGLVVSAIAFATSPAATIAVINSTGASGPMARTVLSAVVLKDVLVVIGFSAGTALATGLLGLATDGGFLLSLWHITQSILLGLALGGAIHLYMRFVGAELLLFLIGMIYTATFVAEQIHAEAALVFIVAGIVVGNFSGERGHELIKEVERLSLPVYVVFFTLAGAKLHLDELWAMLPLALGLVFVRVLALFVGVRAGAQLTAADASIRSYGWMGFVSQAGLAITLATQVKDTYPDGVGEALFSVILGGVALNEMLGPVLLQAGLGLAGEVADDTAPDELPRDPTQEVARDDTPADLNFDDPFGQPLSTGVEPLDNALGALQSDLQSLCRDRTWGPLTDQRHEGERFVQQLRRSFLRLHRRMLTQASTLDLDRDLASALRYQVGDLGDRWRDQVLTMGARAQGSDRWSPLELVEAIDAHVNSLEPLITAPVFPESLAPREESPLRRLRRSLLRARVGIGTTREINLRDLARFHLSGTVPARLEGLAALMVDHELHLAARVQSLFEEVADRWEQAAVAVTDGMARDEVRDQLEACRASVDEELALIGELLERLPAEGANRAAAVTGGGLARLKDDVLVIGTLDLPHRRRRYSKVFALRNQGLAALGSGLAEARRTVTARYQQLALELELVGLEGRVQDAAEVHGHALERLVRGRGARQVELVEEALREWLEATGVVIDEAEKAGRLARQLRSDTEPLTRRLNDARKAVEKLHRELSDESWLTPLLETLHSQAQGLTEYYTVPSRPPAQGSWSLPTSVTPTEVPFRELVSTAIETGITRDLLDLTGDLAERVEELAFAIDEAERVVTFNLDLALGELDVLEQDAPLNSETRELVRAMAAGAVGRSHQRLQRLVEQTQSSDSPRHHVRDAIIGRLERVHQQLLDGQLAQLRLEVFRNSALRGGLLARAGEWTARAGDIGPQIRRITQRIVGPERVAVTRDLLGLPDHHDTVTLREAVRAPELDDGVPVVYRRLFSDHALEGADLLAGRQDELQELREILRDEDRRLRSVAVVSVDTHASHALVNTALRSFTGEVHRLVPDKPWSVTEVEAWLRELPARDVCVVIEDLRWLVRCVPGGVAPLQRVARAIVADGKRRVWVLHADPVSWSFLTHTTTLPTAMGHTVHLGPLSAQDLQDAVLTRHTMSGYHASFGDDDDLPWVSLLWRRSNREQRRREEWFRALHEASAGVMQDALRLWMASIDKVDDTQDAIHLGAVPRPPVARLAELSDDATLTLVQTLRQGWMDTETHAWLFRHDRASAEAHLAKLVHDGLLQETGPRYEVVPHLRGPLERALSARGWV